MGNKITINKIDSICEKKEPVVIKYTVNNEEIELEFSPSLTLIEEQMFIDKVVDSVVGENDYYPGMFDAVFFATYLQMCSNISIPTKKGDIDAEDRIFDMEKIYKWMNETTLYNDLLNNKATGIYIKCLLNKIKRKIDFKLRQLANKSPLVDLINNINSIFETTDLPEMLQEALKNNIK